MTEDQEEKKEEQQEVDSFLEWVNELEEAEQPTCNIENPEDCEACGS